MYALYQELKSRAIRALKLGSSAEEVMEMLQWLAGITEKGQRTEAGVQRAKQPRAARKSGVLCGQISPVCRGLLVDSAGRLVCGGLLTAAAQAMAQGP